MILLYRVNIVIQYGKIMSKLRVRLTDFSVNLIVYPHFKASLVLL